ncbi:hypothetical protein CR161_09910 [Prosthecochloris sp. ZM]|uniref:Fibrobacter succinogenes major paralogous domain-containing protein n=1 Tax=Prosthecochloris aestuarii (strain DSM 271 / SK 413) TaxID=290512 RepID=B4S4Z3_PROA2|nr:MULTISPECIES: fibrobacter succinogenes major paralogous domain-containing protein [Prosthecochloris]ACF45491.1 hypothetical protein Paes_0434 [Prosthecochloris aestuarii DSM 271]RDD30985.1 hypothetical protein CR161_09910 [Prosthecochloris sp. ZM]
MNIAEYCRSTFLRFFAVVAFFLVSPDLDAQTAPLSTPSVNEVRIGDQVWMAKNLDVVRYRNGDLIVQVQDPSEWEQLESGAWCYYDNSSVNGAIYGKLYNWYAVNDPRGLAPEGWRVASDSDWQELIMQLGGEKAAGSYLKSAEGWASPNVGALNTSHFTALPSGYRSSNGSFRLLGSSAVYWSATQSNEYSALSRELFNSYSAVYANSSAKTRGFAVRCLKNGPFSENPEQ